MQKKKFHLSHSKEERASKLEKTPEVLIKNKYLLNNEEIDKRVILKDIVDDFPKV